MNFIKLTENTEIKLKIFLIYGKHNFTDIETWRVVGSSSPYKVKLFTGANLFRIISRK